MSDLHDNYAQAGFGAGLGVGLRPALLIVDFVKAYTLTDSPFYAGVADTADAARTLLDAARRAGLPVVHTCVRYRERSDAGLWIRKIPALEVFVGRGPHGEFETGLEPRPGETVVAKHYASAFFGTSLASSLSARHIDGLLVAGLTTSGCIRATVVDAVQHGFSPVVVEEAVGDRHAEPHRANLFDMQAKYADVIPLAEALDRIGSARSERGT